MSLVQSVRPLLTIFGLDNGQETAVVTCPALPTWQPAGELAQEGTQQLLAALRHALPEERYQTILAHSGQAVVAWQQARRQRAGESLK